MMFGEIDQSFLWASLVWGSIGTGYFLYGRKQKEPWPFAGGLGMIAASFFISAWWLMSLVCLAIIGLVYWLMKQAFF